MSYFLFWHQTKQIKSGTVNWSLLSFLFCFWSQTEQSSFHLKSNFFYDCKVKLQGNFQEQGQLKGQGQGQGKRQKQGRTQREG